MPPIEQPHRDVFEMAELEQLWCTGHTSMKRGSCNGQPSPEENGDGPLAAVALPQPEMHLRADLPPRADACKGNWTGRRGWLTMLFTSS